MGEVKHTPGPWTQRDGTSNLHSVIARSDGTMIAEVHQYRNRNIDPSERQANARLIAVAPDMEAMLIEAKAALEYAARGADVITSDKLAVTIGRIASVLAAVEGC